MFSELRELWQYRAFRNDMLFVIGWIVAVFILSLGSASFWSAPNFLYIFPAFSVFFIPVINAYLWSYSGGFGRYLQRNLGVWRIIASRLFTASLFVVVPHMVGIILLGLFRDSLIEFFSWAGKFLGREIVESSVPVDQTTLCVFIILCVAEYSVAFGFSVFLVPYVNDLSRFRDILYPRILAKAKLFNEENHSWLILSLILHFVGTISLALFVQHLFISQRIDMVVSIALIGSLVLLLSGTINLLLANRIINELKTKRVLRK